MKTIKPGQYGKGGAVAVSVILLTLAGCGGGGGGEEETLDANLKGPPPHSNTQGSSVDITNNCMLDYVAGKPVLRVTTDIIDKSSGDITPYFKENGTTVRAEEKGRGKDAYEQVGVTAIFTGSLGITVTDIQLCDESGAYLGPDDTVSLGATVTVDVDNDNKGEYLNHCSDDPDTADVNEGKVVISSAELNALCAL